jgi:1,4-alpha-glucan branching enzyme
MENLKTERPRTSEQRRVPFVVNAPQASEVIVTGDFTQWSKEGIRLKKSASGRWEATLSLAPGDYQYRLLIDGAWSDDPVAKKQIPNEFGTTNCVLEVRGR